VSVNALTRPLHPHLHPHPLPLFLAVLVLSPEDPQAALDSPEALEILQTMWKEADVGDKKCHFTQRSPGECDKYWHANAAGKCGIQGIRERVSEWL
jgi:hypothetical protein